MTIALRKRERKGEKEREDREERGRKDRATSMQSFAVPRGKLGQWELNRPGALPWGSCVLAQALRVLFMRTHRPAGGELTERVTVGWTLNSLINYSTNHVSHPSAGCRNARS